MATLYGSQIGAPRQAGVLTINGVTTYAMATLDAGWSARFQARTTADILGVKLFWSTISGSDGRVNVRIETDDGLGEPSGTLYDANATITPGASPSAGWNTYTFAVAPTTGLTVGSIYHAVVVTSTAMTGTMTLGSSVGPQSGGQIATVLTGASVTTRTNFAVVASTSPLCVLDLEGGSSVSTEVDFHPFSSNSTNDVVYGTNNVAALNIVTEGTLTVAGYWFDYIRVAGSPAGDLTLALYDTSNNLITDSSVTVDKDLIVSGRGLRVQLPATISLSAATYRIVLTSSGSANSSNCFGLRVANAQAAGVVQNCTYDVSTDWATTKTWTNTNTAVVPGGLLISGITGGGGGAGSTYAMWNH